jgi:FkbM family methyltransferase
MTATKVRGWAKLASRAIGGYQRWSPIQRGKHWLLRRSSSFLIAPVDSGLWIRATGLSVFEWNALRGLPCESATTALFHQVLRPGMVVFDVGANVGYYSMLAARALGATGHVHSFEATPIVANRIRENLAINGLDNVTVNNLAVCDRVGTVEFRVQPDDSEGNSLVHYEAGWETVRVPATTLDEYTTEHKISHVNLIKIDVEGAEGMVLAGASGLLSGDECPVLIIESNPATLEAAGHSPQGIRNLLASHDYMCFGLEELLPEPASVWNILAIHPRHTTVEKLCRQRGLPRLSD